jgi:preprotein translocase SecE subunit
MADKPFEPSRRRVKDPETFRERALKAAEASDKTTRTARLKQAGGQLTSPVLQPAGRAIRGTLAFKPLAPLVKVMRLVGKVVFPVYLRRSWHELRQVEWPNWRESRRLTSAVLIFAIIFGAVIAVVDYGLDKAFRDILLK